MYEDSGAGGNPAPLSLPICAQLFLTALYSEILGNRQFGSTSKHEPTLTGSPTFSFAISFLLGYLKQCHSSQRIAIAVLLLFGESVKLALERTRYAQKLLKSGLGTALFCYTSSSFLLYESTSSIIVDGISKQSLKFERICSIVIL